MSDLRIFSYLPNPRIWKATIAARLCGVDVEVRGSSPKELQSWLWDFDAHPLSSSELATSADTQTGKVGFTGTLHKTAAFMEAHPFGTVPAAFSPDGKTGIFESNSIMRAVARLGEKRFPLYGRDAYEASRIDSFLDASLVFARDSQIYLLSLISGTVSPEIHSRMRDGFTVYLCVESTRPCRPTASSWWAKAFPSRTSASSPNWLCSSTKRRDPASYKRKVSNRFCMPALMPNFRWPLLILQG